jgi:hypothetical protein
MRARPPAPLLGNGVSRRLRAWLQRGFCMSEVDLTGVWDGEFGYPADQPPTSFTAVLIDTNAAFTGTVHEVATVGPHLGQTLMATVEGARSGAAVQFTKRYDGQDPTLAHAIDYEGELSEDATEIRGRWAIPQVWSGPFVMRRPLPTEVAQEVADADAVGDAFAAPAV